MIRKQTLLLAWAGKMPVRNELDIIEQIKMHRNNILSALLTPEALGEYLFLHFRVKHASSKKMSSLKGVIISMILSPLDLNRYCRMIKAFMYQDKITFTEAHELFIYDEIDGLLKDYID